MPLFEITDNAGKTYQIRADSEAEAFQAWTEMAGAQATTAGRVSRGAGLTARGLMEGMATGAAFPATLPMDVGYGVVQGVRQALGDENAGSIIGFPATGAVMNAADAVGDAIGLPQPVTGGERLATAAISGAASAGTGAGVGTLMRRAGTRSGNDLVARTGRALSANPVTQTVAGGTAGTAAEAMDQRGAHPLAQMVAGVAAGGGVAGVSGLIRGGRNAVLRPITEGGREKLVGEALARQATKPQELPIGVGERGLRTDPRARPAPTYVPDSQPTLGEAKRDIGLLRAQRGIQNTDAYGKRLADNLGAQQRFLQDSRLPKQQYDALRDARTQFNAQELARILPPGGTTADVTALRQTLGQLSLHPDARSEPIRKALAYARQQLDEITQTGQTGGPRGTRGVLRSSTVDGRELHVMRENLRSFFDTTEFVDSNRLGREAARRASKAAYSRVKPIMDEIDAALDQATGGEFSKYLTEARRRAVEVDQHRAMREIERRVTSSGVPAVQNDANQLLSAQIRKVIDGAMDGDDFSRLSPSQQQVLRRLRDDLDRAQSMNAPDVKPSGVSNTAFDQQNRQTVMQHVVRSSRLADLFRKYTQEQIDQLFAEALVDPEIGFRLLAKADPRVVESTLGRFEQMALGMFGRGRDAAAGTAGAEDQ